jgi:hypothetical protein
MVVFQRRRSTPEARTRGTAVSSGVEGAIASESAIFGSVAPKKCNLVRECTFNAPPPPMGVPAATGHPGVVDMFAVRRAALTAVNGSMESS